MNKKLLLFLFIILFIEFKWSLFYESFNGQHHVPFKLVSFMENTYIKCKHKYFNKPLDLEICKENLLLFNEIMTLHKIPFWLSEGTALGVIRDGSFILWDDDVDTAFMHEYRDQFLKKVLPILFSNNFTLGGSMNNGNFIALHRKGEKIDIDIVQSGGKCNASQTKNANTNDCNNILKYLNNMKEVQFLGTTFNVPGEDYLEYLYSSSWKTPSKSKLKNIPR